MELRLLSALQHNTAGRQVLLTPSIQQPSTWCSVVLLCLILPCVELSAVEAVEVIEQTKTESPKETTKTSTEKKTEEKADLINADQAFFIEVNSLMRIEAYDQAITKLEAYYKTHPDSKQAEQLLLNARIQQNEQRLRETLKDQADLHDTIVDPQYLAAKEVTDKHIAQRLSVVEYLVQEEKYAEALKILNEVLTVDKNNRAALLFKDRLVESMLRIERERLLKERKIQREKAINDIIGRGNQDDPKQPIPRVYRIFQEDIDEAEREKLMVKLRVPLKSFNYNEAPLDAVLKQLFAIAGLNYIIYDDAIGDETLTLSLRDETVESVLYTIQRMAGVRFNYHGGSVYVTSVDNPILVTEVIRLRSGLTNVLAQPQLQGITGGVNNASDDNQQGNQRGGQQQQISQLLGGDGEEQGDGLSDVERFLERVPELIDWPDGSTIFLDKKSSTIMLRSSPSTISEFKRLLKAIDYTTEQVLIEARFVEVSDNAMKNIGVNWTVIADNDSNNPNRVIVGGASSGASVNPLTDLSNPTNQFAFADTLAGSTGFTAGIIGQGNDIVPNFSAQLNLLEDKGEANTLSEPKILTLSNLTGVIDIRSEIAYIEDVRNEALPSQVNNNDGGTSVTPTNFAGVPQYGVDYEGINLTVKPSVAPNGDIITIEVKPVVRELISLNTENFIVPGAGETGLRIQQPSFSTRQVSTTLHVRDGETVVLGGLISEFDEDTHNGIPGLGRAPIIGGLFRNTSKTTRRRRLLIFLTATIIDPTGASYQKQLEHITNTARELLPVDVREIKAAKEKAAADARTEALINSETGVKSKVRTPGGKKKGRR